MSQTEQRKPHLSPTQLDMLSKCGEQYRRRYVEGERQPPGMAMLRGTGVHKGIELNFRQKIDSRVDLPAKDVIDAAVSGFESQLKGGYEMNEDEVSRGAAVVIGETKDTVARLAELAADEMCPEYQPVLVEQVVRIELAGSHDLLGVIDLADERGRVIDTKTAAKSKSQNDADGSMQLTAYSAMHKLATGALPTELRMEVLVDTKKPKRQTLVTTRGPDDLAALAARIDAATRVIQAGLFVPATPGAWWCSGKWCGFYSTCRFVNSGRAPQGD
jgi:translation elongation factor EF-G